MEEQEPQAPAPYYDDGRIMLYLGDTREVLNSPALREPWSVVVTDPPYAAWRYLQEMSESKRMNLPADLAWQANVFSWVTEWFWAMRQHQADDAACWLFCNLHYLGFYLRWSRMAGWFDTRLWAVGADEFLVYNGPPLDPNAAMALGELLQRLNRYGHGKDVAMLRAMLRASPPGHVLDPFAGTGTTLLAARAEGRPATGIEIVEESCAAIVQKLRA